MNRGLPLENRATQLTNYWVISCATLRSSACQAGGVQKSIEINLRAQISAKKLFLRAEPAKIQKYKTAVFKAADLGSNPSRSVSEKFEKSAILEPKS